MPVESEKAPLLEQTCQEELLSEGMLNLAMQAMKFTFMALVSREQKESTLLTFSDEFMWTINQELTSGMDCNSSPFHCAVCWECTLPHCQNPV